VFYYARHSLSVLFGGLLLIWLSGCSTMLSQAIEEPTLRINGISIKEVNLTSVDLILDLTVTNPNDFKLALSSYEYVIELNEHPMFKGEEKQSLSIPALGESRLTVPLTLGVMEILSLLQDVKLSNLVSYNAEARMYVDAPLLRSVPIKAQRDGSLDLSKLGKPYFK